MELVALPGNASKDCYAGCMQCFMGITDVQLYSSQALIHQSVQETFPIQLVLTQLNGFSENETLARNRKNGKGQLPYFAGDICHFHSLLSDASLR